MGCGQSHIAVIYPRKSKQKGSSPQSDQGADYSDEDRTERVANENETQNDVTPQSSGSVEDEDAAARMRQMVQLSNSPLLAHQELSTSQSDFFRMLDEKINNGPDYDGSCEFEFTLDHAQLCRMLQEWHAAKHRSRYSGMGGDPGGGPKMQKYHSLQSNGEAGGGGRRLTHQTSFSPPTYSYPDPYGAPHPHPHQNPHYQSPNYPRYYTQVGPQPPPYHIQQAPPPPTYHHQYHHLAANSVVMYDKSRGGYYTELA